MSEIQASTAAAATQPVAPTGTDQPSAAASSQSATATPAPAAQPTAEVDGETGRSRETTGRARASQERISGLQDEREQIRERREQLRAERQEARRAGRQEAREQRLAERRAGREERRAEREQRRAERREARRAERGTGGPQQAPPAETQRPDAGTTTPPTPAPAPETGGTTDGAVTPPATTERVEPTQATGIRITGNVRQTTGEVSENEVAFDESTVARERGIAGAAIDDPDEGVTFRFEETGDGLVRATRFETVDGEEVAVGSQTLDITSVGNDDGRAVGTLSFDDIGLELDIDEEFTPGDLHFVEISSGPAAATEAVAGSFTPQAPAPATDAPDPEEALRQLDERERQIELTLSAEESSLLALVGRLEDAGSSSTDDVDPLAGLRELADSLVVPGSPSPGLVTQLLT